MSTVNLSEAKEGDIVVDRALRLKMIYGVGLSLEYATEGLWKCVCSTNNPDEPMLSKASMYHSDGRSLSDSSYDIMRIAR